jgi:hypothetical protein
MVFDMLEAAKHIPRMNTVEGRWRKDHAKCLDEIDANDLWYDIGVMSDDEASSLCSAIARGCYGANMSVTRISVTNGNKADKETEGKLSRVFAKRASND